MEQTFFHHDKSLTLEIENTGGGFTVSIGEKTIALKPDFENDNEFRAVVNGVRKTFYIARDRENIYVFLDGRQYVFCEDRGSAYGATERVADAAGDYMSSPMPGTIIKINCKEGDTVNENDTLVIVEAMKMENVLRSPVDGVVKKINNVEGDLVDAGAPIVELEKEN